MNFRRCHSPCFFLFSGRLCFIKYTIVPLFSPDPPEDSCPPLRPMPGCSLVKNYCTDDSQCADGEKCCLRKDCVKRCSTLAKAGKCHKTDPKPCPAILRPHECTTDWDCAGEHKCCSDGCIKKCTSLFVTPFEGMVWFYKSQNVVTCFFWLWDIRILIQFGIFYQTKRLFLTFRHG